MRTILFILLFLITAIGAAIYFTPLGFVLAQANLQNNGIQWAQVEGTLMEGRISGLYVQDQAIGDVSLKLQPLSLLSLSPTYDVQWGGPGGRGTGTFSASPTTVKASDVRLQQSIASITALDPQIRALGGNVRVTNGSIELTRESCRSATGDISTDMLQRIAAQYGRDFGMVSGPLSCESGDILLALAGQSAGTDRLTINARGALSGAASFEAAVETQDSEISILLSNMGLQFSDGAWRYTMNVPAGGGL